VDFADFSRYSAISMFGAAMMLAISVDRLQNVKLRLGFVLLLIGMASLPTCEWLGLCAFFGCQ